jgi:hypothetical protein
MYVTPDREKLRRQPPTLRSRQESIGRAVLDRIEISYVDSASELQLFLASVHTSGRQLPSVIVVDDVDLILPKAEASGQVQCVSYWSY